MQKKGQSVRRGLFYGIGTCCDTYGRAMAQSVSRWPVIVEARVRSQTSSCGVTQLIHQLMHLHKSCTLKH